MSGRGLLLQDKVTAVQNLEASSTTSYGGGKAAVGNSVNDAPALAAAHARIAMGRVGSDFALDTVDAAISRDQLRTVPAVIALARRARGSWSPTSRSRTR